MKKLSKTIGKMVAIITAISTIAIALSMVVYFFNLDMKLTSKLEKPLDWWYDRLEKDRGL